MLKRTLKYLIAILFGCSLLTIIFPVIEYQGSSISVMDIFRLSVTGKLQYLSDDSSDIIQQFISPFFPLGIVLLFTILICAIYILCIDWKESYVIAAVGTVIVNGELAYLLWILYDKVLVHIRILFMFIFEELRVQFMPLYLWCLIYIIIFLASIWGITQIIVEKLEMKEATYRDSHSVDRRSKRRNFGNISKDESEKNIRCPMCGKTKEKDANYCDSCGYKFQ